MIYIDGKLFRHICLSAPTKKEKCGVMSGHDGTVNRLFTMKNVSKDDGRYQFSLIQKVVVFSYIFFTLKANTIIIWHTHKEEEKLSKEDIKNSMDCSLIPGKKIFYMVVTTKGMKIYKIEKEKNLYYIFEQQFKVV